MDRFIDAFSYIKVNKLIICQPVLDRFKNNLITAKKAFILWEQLHFQYERKKKNVGSTNPLASGKNAEEQITRSVQLKI